MNRTECFPFVHDGPLFAGPDVALKADLAFPERWPDWRPAPTEPFPLATDAPSAPPLRVRTLDALPFPLVRRTPAQAQRDAEEAFARALAAYRGEGPGDFDSDDAPDDPWAL